MSASKSLADHELIQYEPEAITLPLALTCPTFAPLGWTGETNLLSLEDYREVIGCVKVDHVQLWPTACRIMQAVDAWAAKNEYAIHAVVAGGLAAWPFARAGEDEHSPTDCDVFFWREKTHLAFWEHREDKCNQLAAFLYDTVLTSIGEDCKVILGQGIINVNHGSDQHLFQLILKVYDDIGDVLNSFDLNSAKVACDSEGRVWMTRESLRANVCRINTVDPAARSITYERRLVKYFDRGYAVEFPHLLNISRNDFVLSPKNNPSGVNRDEGNLVRSHRLKFQVIAVLNTQAVLGFGKLRWTGLDEYDAARALESSFYFSEPHYVREFECNENAQADTATRRFRSNLFDVRCHLSGKPENNRHIVLRTEAIVKLAERFDGEDEFETRFPGGEFDVCAFLRAGNANPLALCINLAPDAFGVALNKAVRRSGRAEYLVPLLANRADLLVEYIALRTDGERHTFLAPHIARLVEEVRATPPLPYWIYPAGARAARLPAPETPERWYGDRYGVAPPPTLPPGGVPDYVGTLITDTCAICREPLYDGKNVLKLPCGHAFHWTASGAVECPGLKRALKIAGARAMLKCPTCRAET